MPLGLALAAIPSVAKGIYGIAQMVQGRSLLNGLDRPQYEIPSAENEALGLARAAYADPRMPGENVMYDRASLASANALDGASQMGGGLGSVAAILAGQNIQDQNIGIASANYQDQARANYQQALGTHAGYQDTEWQMNKFAPYAQKYEEGRQMIGAGAQNAFAGLDSIGGLAAGYLGAKAGVSPSVVATDRYAQTSALNEAASAQMLQLLQQLAQQRSQGPQLQGLPNMNLRSDSGIPRSDSYFNQ